MAATARSPTGLPSPWAHVVRGEPDPSSPSSTVPPPPLPEPEPKPLDRSRPDPAEAAPGSSEGCEQVGNGNAAVWGGRKLAWNRPSNSLAEAGPVMGAVSWPALSECTRSSHKSSSDALKAVPDGSASAPPGPAGGSSPLRLSANNPNPNSSANHAPPARQRSMKRSTVGGGGGGGGGAPANGGLTLPLPPPAEMPHATPDKHAGSERSPKNNATSNSWDPSSRSSGFSPQTYTGGDHHQGYSGNRRGSNGGSNYGSRRDQERGGGAYEWNQPRGFTGRDVHMQPPLPCSVPRPFIAPLPPTTAPFMVPPPPPVRPYGDPMGFSDMPSPVFYIPATPEPHRGMPFVAPAVTPVMFVAPPDHRAMLVKQIDYYFSSENLCKDIYLRQNMDDRGWVPVSLIAMFNRVKQLTNNIKYILDAVQASEVVEVQGDKLRRRNDWMNWVLPPSPNQYGVPGMQSPVIPNYGLTALIQGVGLEDGTTNHSITTGPTHHDVMLNRSGSGNFMNQSLGNDSNGEWSGSSTKHRVRKPVTMGVKQLTLPKKQGNM